MKKVYLITGAGHFPGMGSCLAEHLLRTGQRVVVNSRSFDDRWHELAVEFSDSLVLVAGDITNSDAQDSMVRTAIDAWGQIDSVINNASTLTTSPNPNRDEWNLEFLMNVIVPYELAMKSAEYLRKTKGSIVMIGSRSGIQVGVKRNNGSNLSYSVAKSAQHHLAKSLSVMLGPEIIVNAVAPGMFQSARWKNKWGDEGGKVVEQKFIDSSLTDDILTIEGIIDSILMLAHNRNLTGQVLPVCAGTSVHRAN
jgi:NAD(P)-dependent dehydrogenase (short-subunit alcohol dehydrogenase family)